MVTCDFGASSLTVDPFLLGVVFDDLDQDGLYSAGGVLSASVRI